MIKNGNGRIVSEQEKLELENKELIIKDIQSNECQGKTTQKIVKNKKRIKEIMEEDKKKKFEPLETYDSWITKPAKRNTAQKKKEVGADDIIKETN